MEIPKHASNGASTPLAADALASFLLKPWPVAEKEPQRQMVIVSPFTRGATGVEYRGTATPLWTQKLLSMQTGSEKQDRTTGGLITFLYQRGTRPSSLSRRFMAERLLACFRDLPSPLPTTPSTIAYKYICKRTNQGDKNRKVPGMQR